MVLIKRTFLRVWSFVYCTLFILCRTVDGQDNPLDYRQDNPLDYRQDNPLDYTSKSILINVTVPTLHALLSTVEHSVDLHEPFWPSGAIRCGKNDICLCYGNSSNPATSGCVGRNCFCDEFCEDNDDCCIDYVRIPKFNDTLHREWIEDVVQCQQVWSISYSSINIITLCPSQYSDQNVRQLCENEANDELSDWPVTGKKSGFLYKNIYCSTCNEEFNVEFWVKNVTCQAVRIFAPKLSGRENETEISDYARKRQMQFVGHATADEEKYCTKKKYTSVLPINTCEQNNKRPPQIHFHSCAKSWQNDTVRDFCEKGYTSYVENRFRYKYKNWYCALCNDINGNDVNCNIWTPFPADGKRDKWPTQVYLSPVLENGVAYYPVSILFDANTGKQASHSVIGYEQSSFDVKTETVMKTCNDGYLVLGDRCVFIQCGEGYIFKNDKCINKSENNFKGLNSVKDKKRCHTTKLNEDRYTILANGSLIITFTDQIVEPLWYKNVTENGTRFIEACLATDVFSKNYTTIQNRTISLFTLKFDQVQTWISFVGQILSTVALFILFLAYAVSPSLRNVPGKCVMSLAVSLGLAQLLYLIGIGRIQPVGLCYVLSVLIHYMYLAAFFWMNVMAFDICRVFAGNQSQTSIEQSRWRFLYYCLYTWLAPAGIVLVAILVDQYVVLNPGFTEFYFVPNYGNGLCFIASRDALLLFFIIPIALLILVNFVLYIVTARGLYIAMKDAMLVRQAKRNSCKLLVYLKLSLIMGLTWTFGFLQAAIDEPWISYVFVILNVFQGLLICISFLCTENVSKMFRKRYRKSLKVRTKKKTILTRQTGNAGSFSFLTDNNRLTRVTEQETTV